jgi:hypothetical protein
LPFFFAKKLNIIWLYCKKQNKKSEQIPKLNSSKIKGLEAFGKIIV